MASKKILSVELGVQTTRICEIECSGKKKTIINTCVFDTPEGTVEDGYVRNKDILAVSIRAAMQKKLMSAKDVIFSISSSKIANREVNMPYLAQSKIPDFIHTNAKEYFPIEIEKYVITYKVLEDIKDSDQRKLRILVLAAPNDLIETYYELSSALSLQIIAIDYAGNSSYQVLKKQNFKGVNVIVQLNETNTLINIMKGNILLLQRTVPYGVSSIVDAAIMCGEFDIVDKTTAIEKLLSDTLVNPKLNESAIDDVALSYMDSNNDAYSQQIKQMKAKDQITDAFNYLVNNTVRVLDYYTSKFPEDRVESVYLAGIGCRIKGILPLFKNEVFREIRKMDNVLGIDFGRTAGITNEEKSDFIVTAGACIEAVDFVPKQHAEQLKNKRQDAVINKILAAMLGFAVIVVGIPGVKYIKEFASEKTMKKEINDYSDVRMLLDNISVAEVSYSNASTLFTNTMEFSYVLNVLFKEIEDIIPSKTKLESFNYTTEGVTLAVKSTSFDEVGEFVKNLKGCALVSEVLCEGVTVEENEGLVMYNYEVGLTYEPLTYERFIDKEFTPTEDAIREMLGITTDNSAENASKDEGQ